MASRTVSDPLPPFQADDPEVYEHFMGRWSAGLAEPFLDFADVGPGATVLDVGCGTGTITLASARRGASTIGLDASESYLEGARRLRTHPGAEYVHGDAHRLPYNTAAFDRCISMLVIDVVPEVDVFAAEMRRVTRPGGVVACGTFDFWGGNAALDLVLDTGAVLDEGIATLRNQIKSRPIVWAHGQADLWRRTELADVQESTIVLGLDYADFEDYWTSWSTGPTRIAQHLMAMPSDARSRIEHHVRAGYLAALPDGARSFVAVVRAVRGTVPRRSPEIRDDVPGARDAFLPNPGATSHTSGRRRHDAEESHSPGGPP
jgi:SAM-dependent methyltransferase